MKTIRARPRSVARRGSVNGLRKREEGGMAVVITHNFRAGGKLLEDTGRHILPPSAVDFMMLMYSTISAVLSFLSGSLCSS